jgi:hypothetical protein
MLHTWYQIRNTQLKVVRLLYVPFDTGLHKICHDSIV